MNPLLAGTRTHITDVGVFTQDQLLVAQMINDQYPALHLVRNPNYTAEPGQMDCAVICVPDNAPMYVLFYINQVDIDYRVLARIYAADMAKQKRPLEDQLRANEMARELFQQAKVEEEKAEIADLHKSILKSPLHQYKHNGRVYS